MTCCLQVEDPEKPVVWFRVIPKACEPGTQMSPKVQELRVLISKAGEDGYPS